MRAIHKKFCLALVAGCILLPCLARGQAVANKQAVLSQARRAYYNLRTEGLQSFECGITPNWEMLLQKEHEQNPEGVEQAIKTLSQLQFTLNLAADSSVKLTHNTLEGQSEQMMDALKQIYEGMEQMASGFFDTWKLFMLAPPFPEVDSQYDLTATGSEYRLSYKEDTTTDVVTTMSRDFAINNMKITTSEFDSAIQPAFATTPKGLILSSYEAVYQSQKPEESTHLKVHIGYNVVDGIQVPQKLSLSGSYGGAPFNVELGFSDCKVTKKQ